MKRSYKIGCLLLLSFPLMLVGCPIAYFLRPLATRGDLEMAIASNLNADSALASEVCGMPVRRFIGPRGKDGKWNWATVKLQSWRPLFPTEGTMTSRVSGIGEDDYEKPVAPLRTARVTFSYYCERVENGRSATFGCHVTAPPVVVRE